MSGSLDPHQLDQFQLEIVTMDDGRYLIYYGWPARDEDDAALETPRAPHPRAEPWSPQGGPADV